MDRQQHPLPPSFSPWAKLPVSNPAPSSVLPPANAPAPGMFSKEGAPLAGEEESFLSKTKVHFANQDYKEQGEKKKKAASNNSVL